jgi:ribosome maturation factor RimP
MMSEREVEQLQDKIETRLAEVEPGVELIALERIGNERLRLFIDSADGVTLELCERVTKSLPDLLEDWGLEVSSPGPERPLTKPEHFQRFLGSRVRVKTSEEIAGRTSFTGELTAADAEQLNIAAPDGDVTIPLASIHRSNLIPEKEAA